MYVFVVVAATGVSVAASSRILAVLFAVELPAVELVSFAAGSFFSTGASGRSVRAFPL